MKTYKDINARITQIVKDLFANGYGINAGTMNSLQTNEATRIDFTNGKDILRLLTSRFSEDGYKGVAIIVGRPTEPVTPNESTDTLAVIWNTKLDVIYREEFFYVGRSGVNHSDSVYGTKEEAIAAEKLRRSRLNRADTPYYSDVKTAGWERVASDYIRRVCRKQKVAKKDLHVRRDIKGRHLVTYRGETFAMC